MHTNKLRVGAALAAAALSSGLAVAASTPALAAGCAPTHGTYVISSTSTRLDYVANGVLTGANGVCYYTGDHYQMVSLLHTVTVTYLGRYTYWVPSS